MKRHVLLLLLAFIGIGAMAQEFSTDEIGKSPIDIRGSRVFVEDYQLDKYTAATCFSSLNGIDMSQDYLKYRKGYKVGAGLLIGGASLTVVGFGTTLAAFVSAFSAGLTSKNCDVEDFFLGVGVVSMVTGSLCFLAGIPTICVYKTKLNRLEKKYNTSLSLGASPGGLSMAISF
ncbi:MAG: hypothetical protein J6Q73_03395 [Bacteroidaceae bacterium]|nr:hypothetical protein [Bacteroidaceae bacterium]